MACDPEIPSLPACRRTRLDAAWLGDFHMTDIPWFFASGLYEIQIRSLALNQRSEFEYSLPDGSLGEA